MTFTTQLDAQSIQYSWTGLIEQSAPNPWSLSGDGDQATLLDGTPFSIQAIVGTDVLSPGFNPNFSNFPVNATLTIGDQIATTSNNILSFSDDSFSGQYDGVAFQADATLFGVTQFFQTNVLLDNATFSLPDIPQSTRTADLFN